MGRHQLISVICNSRKIPCQVKGQQVQEILEHWNDTGCWWAGEDEKSFYRLRCDDESIYEIYLELGQQLWYLYKTYD